MLDIALCINDRSGNYYKHALVTMVSALENASCGLAFHILHDDTLLPNIRVFQETAACYGQPVHFYNLEQVDFSSFCSEMKHWGKGTLYRLVLHDYVTTDSVLYLDCDIVVNIDLAELRTIAMQDNIIAAVQEKSTKENDRSAVSRVKNLNMSPVEYFNAGVLLIDTAKLRFLSDIFRQEIAASFAGNKLTYLDQDALNLFFAKRPGSVLYLDEKYNQQIGRAGIEAHIQDFSWYKEKVLHFANTKKPWDFFSQSSILYWKYYALAFPNENVLEHIETTRQHNYNALFIFLLRSPKIRSFVRRARDITTKGLWASIRSRMFPAE